jgi:alpha-tubulin suppressor-like RCC1 family protein
VLGRALRSLAPLRVVSLSAGYGHVAAITADGGVYTFGDGEIGQLGHGSEDNALLPRRVGGALSGVRAVAVAAGSEHTAVVGEGGEVFTFGDGEYAPLGHGDEENALAPRLVAGLAGRVVVDVAAGWRHTAVVTDEGELWTFGRGWQGRLGHGDIENRLVPTRVAAFGPGAGEERAAAVSAGAGHTLVATDSGGLWTFGGGGEGQLGHGDHEDQLLPKAVVRFDGLAGDDDDDDGRRRGEEEEEEVRVVAVDADARHSVVLDAAGRVFTFGFGEGRRLGHADEGSRVCPTLVGALRASEAVVVAVAAGAGFTAALSSSGRIWTSTGGLSGLST